MKDEKFYEWIEELDRELELAIELEEYEIAAFLRDALKYIREEDEISYFNLVAPLPLMLENDWFNSDTPDEIRVQTLLKKFGYSSVFQYRVTREESLEPGKFCYKLF